MPDEPEGFARRWSRLKREAPAAPVVVPEPGPPAEIPPPADSIALEDIGPWLAKKLPEGWRETVLRRVWSADPSIRDFAGLADYAWDWNTPGGAPGWGPLRAADDIAKLLARAIGEPIAPPDPAPDPAPDLLPDPPPGPLAEVSPEPLVDQRPALAESGIARIEEAPAPISTERDEPAIHFRRRGGRAAPV